MFRKVLGVALIASILLPSLVSAQSLVDLQAQIAALLAQVQALQAQLAQQQVSQTAPTPPQYGDPGFCYGFSANLRVGDSGTEVRALQTALEREGFTVNAAEKSSGTFGDSTAAAVVGFQEKYASEILTPNDLVRGTGFVGASTRAKLNQLYQCKKDPSLVPIQITDELSQTTTTVPSLYVSVVRNPSVGTQTIARGSQNVRIGSYVLTASSSQGANINVISLSVGSGASSLFNIRLQVGSTQFGTTLPSVISGPAYSFNGSLSIPAGQSRVVDVYADVSSSAAGNYSSITALAGCSGTTMNFSALTCLGPISGQDISVPFSASAISVSIDNSLNPPAQQLVMGSIGNKLAAWRFTETKNIEDIKITDLTIYQKVSSTALVKQGLLGVGLYVGDDGKSRGSALVGNQAPDGSGYFLRFSFPDPIIVPKSGSVSLALRGDVASFSSGGATDASHHTFQILNPQSMIAFGVSSNASATVSLGNTISNRQTILRTKVDVGAQALGSPSNRVRSVADDLSTIRITANAAGSVRVNALQLTFSGNALSLGFAEHVGLIDQNGLDVTTSLGATKNAISSCTNQCPITWHFGSSGLQIGAGQSYNLKLRVNSMSGFGNGSVLGVGINNANSLVYTTAISGGTSGVTLPPTAVPIVVNNITFDGTTSQPPAPTPSLTVISPNGGETFTAGQGTITVKYRSQGIVGQPLTVRLWHTIQGAIRTMNVSAVNEGSVDIALEKGGADPAGQYIINICAEGIDSPGVTGKPLCDSSDSSFALKEPITVSYAAPVMVYPKDGQTLGLGGGYMFKVEPIPGATGYLYGFKKDLDGDGHYDDTKGELIHENLRDFGTLSTNGQYAIWPNNVHYSKFTPGIVQVWIRAVVNGQWTDSRVINIRISDPSSASSNTNETNVSLNQLANIIESLKSLLERLIAGGN